MSRPTRAEPREGAGRHRVRTDIQGLRAVAVGLVALNHAGLPGLGGGYVGVDVFFVISGLLITQILLTEAERTGRVSIAGFYAKRARRILPAATVVLLVTLVASLRLLDYVRAGDVAADVIWAAFFGANLRFAGQGTNYFDADLTPSPVQHFWSLAVEEQFYLLWPALLAAVLFLGLRRLLGLVLVAVCVASLCWSVVHTPTDPNSAYFSTLTRAWELGAGALLALFASWLSRIPTGVQAGLSWAGLGAVMTAAVTYSESTSFPGYHALLPVAGAAAILVGGMGGSRLGAGVVLGRQPLRWIGDVSYSLYLWHWPFLILPVAYLDRDLSLRANLLLLGGAVVAAAVTYHLVENPFRRAPALARDHRRALALWPAAIATILVAALSGHALVRAQPLAGESVDVAAEVAKLPESERADRSGDPIRDEVAKSVNKAKVGAALPEATEPGLADLRDDRSRGPESCEARFKDTEGDICPVGDPDADRTMVVLGDSHAGMWAPALDELGRREGWTVVPLVKLACPPADVVAWRDGRSGPYEECGEWRSWALQQVERIQPDAVVVGSKAELNLMDASGEQRLSGPAAVDAWRSGMRSTLQRLHSVTPRVTVLGAIPLLPEDPNRCLANREATMADCTVELDPRTKKANAATTAAAGDVGVKYVDPLPWFCAKERCPLVLGETVPYADGNPHLTQTYATKLVDELSASLRLGGRTTGRR